ncbi:unnamed protein product [Urochloa humidicola]
MMGPSSASPSLPSARPSPAVRSSGGVRWAAARERWVAMRARQRPRGRGPNLGAVAAVCARRRRPRCAAAYASTVLLSLCFSPLDGGGGGCRRQAWWWWWPAAGAVVVLAPVVWVRRPELVRIGGGWWRQPPAAVVFVVADGGRGGGPGTAVVRAAAAGPMPLHFFLLFKSVFAVGRKGYTVKKAFAVCALPRGTHGKGFTVCIWVFTVCFWHTAKTGNPVVNHKIFLDET